MSHTEMHASTARSALAVVVWVCVSVCVCGCVCALDSTGKYHLVESVGLNGRIMTLTMDNICLQSLWHTYMSD